MITNPIWTAADLRITPAQAEFLENGDVKCVSPKVAALTEDSLARRKMIAWREGRDGFFLRANAKGKAALEKYRSRKLVAANDNKMGEADNAAA